MKKEILLICLSMFAILPKAQDTLLISFENDNGLSFIDSISSDNIWQIGNPSKTLFNASYSGDKAILTDTLQSYPTNCDSWFNIKVPSQYLNENGICISFWHKYDTDTINDYGDIHFSIDGGLNWGRLNDTSTIGFDGHWQHWDSSLTHGTGVQNLNITGSPPAWINSESGWIFSEYYWIWSMPSKNFGMYDSIYLKFNFHSDDNENNKEGWMIDDITIREIRILAIEKNGLDSDIILFPNPANESISIRLPEDVYFDKYSLYSISGELVNSNRISGKEVKIDIREFTKGMYVFKLHTVDNVILTKKVLIR